MARKNTANAKMETMNSAEITPAETTSTKRTMTPEEKAARKTAKKAAKKAASAVVRDFLASAEGKEWATAAGDFGQALLTLFPGRPAATVKEGKSSAQREAAKCALVFNYIAEHGTVTDLEMFQEFKVGVAETRKLIRDVTKKAEKAGETLSVFIRRTEDGEGWEAIQAEPAAEAEAPAAE